MSKFRRVGVLLLLVITLLVVPATALANKQLYKARLSATNELHEVVDSTAYGAGNIAVRADASMTFLISVTGLSGPPTGVHLHAPATESETAGVIITLCGIPAPAALATCSFDPATSTMRIEGEVTSSLAAQWGLGGAQFQSWLNGGLVYVNVHTTLNPMGEARGQLYPR